MQNGHRKYLIAGNWKMNKTPAEAAELAQEVISLSPEQTDVSVVLCPPFTALDAVSKIIEGSHLQLGAQNMHPQLEGAYTGEISSVMLRDLYCTFVILGHSERRQYFGETNALINEKTLAALNSNLKPIVCVGESLEEREQEKTLEVVETQVREALKDVETDKAENVVIAYEPIWAIGTGKTATPQMAQEVHLAIRRILAELFDTVTANKIRILYGGSMKPENASELLDQEDIDGGLIGGASLKAKSFIKLVEAAQSKIQE